MGSEMACAGSHVKDTVMAYRVPHDTFSTRWRFSVPEEKKETRPGQGRNTQRLLSETGETQFIRVVKVGLLTFCEIAA